MNLRCAALLFLAFLLSGVRPAHAAESLDTCTGFVDSASTVIGAAGVWCLRKDLSTSITSGAAITIATNNVTLDCNGFKLGGLAGGSLTGASGIAAFDRQNVTVRNCNVRGFQVGIRVSGGAGHLLEDNRLDNNTLYGIHVTGENNLVQRNRVFDTGGYPAANYSAGIVAAADILDNTVAGVFAVSGPDTYPSGILSSGAGYEVRDNRVRGLAPTGAGSGNGINVSGAGRKISGNWVSAEESISGIGIYGDIGTTCMDNIVYNFSTAYSLCSNGSGNVP